MCNKIRFFLFLKCCPESLKQIQKTNSRFSFEQFSNQFVNSYQSTSHFFIYVVSVHKSKLYARLNTYEHNYLYGNVYKVNKIKWSKIFGKAKNLFLLITI